MASKNIVAKGTTYNGVESVTFPVSGGGDATFYEISDTTCTASDVLNSKYFYSSSGVKTQGTGTVPSPTLITKSITANGTYNASSDNADGYSSVTVSVSGGGNWTWMGNNATLVQTPYSAKTYLVNTPFNTWTPTTSQTYLSDLPSGFTYSCTANDGKDYVAILRWHTHFVYEPNTEEKAIITDAYGSFGAVQYSYCSNLATITSDGFNAHIPVSTSMSTGVFYKTTSGSDSFTTNNYGVYLVAPSSSGGSTSFTLSDASLYARCSNSYFSTASASLVDKSASYIEVEIKLYSVDGASSLFGGVREEIRNMYKNGF